ncbi:MAG: hypothetical protein IKR71_00535 [Bacteroidales bacterium]|nr:hypothetical protein [Bacteroidales bacterium]
MKKVLLIVFALLLGAATTVSAQYTKTGLSFQLGGVLPSLEFDDAPTSPIIVPGTNSFDHGGGAMFGASFGVKYTYMIKNKERQDIGLGVFLSVDAMWNAMNKDLRGRYDSLECTHPQYVNIPIMAGVSYTTQFSSVFGIWVEAGIGADLFFKTAEGWKNSTTEYKLNAEFAMEGGVGFIFNRTVSLGAHYYWFGTHDVRTKKHMFGGVELPNNSYSMKMGVWAFKLGFHF